MAVKRIVITGGPGTGKSSVIQELKVKKYHCFDEISRAVILEARQEGIEQLFLEQPIKFSERLLEGRLHQYQEAQSIAQNIAFYDRGLPDVVAYLEFFNTPYEVAFTTICEDNPYDTVFILEPWEAIFTKDNERYESFDEALRIDNALKHTYKRLGYQPVVVPKCAVTERVTFIEQYLKL